MAQSFHETRNPMEVSAKVQACMMLDLDYKLNCFTADDGEKAFTLEIPELDMGRMFAPAAPTPHIVPISETKPKASTRITLNDLAKRLSEGN